MAVTLRDVADLAGVSFKTVSNVVNGYPHIRPATREKVEHAIAEHPDVAEVTVLGVPDAVMGEKVGAVVVPRDGAALDAGALLAFVQGRLADFKIPQYVVVQAEALARNPGGKVVKHRLRGTVAWGPELRRRARD